MFSSGCLFKFIAWIQNRYCIFPSVNRAVNCVFISFHVNAASSESNQSAAGPRKMEPKSAFLRSSYMVWMLFLFATGLLPIEKLIFFSSKRINAVVSSLESIPITFSNAKSGYATVFAILFLTSLVPPSLFNFLLLAITLFIQVALTWIRSFIYRLVT